MAFSIHIWWDDEDAGDDDIGPTEGSAQTSPSYLCICVLQSTESSPRTGAVGSDGFFSVALHMLLWDATCIFSGTQMHVWCAWSNSMYFCRAYNLPALRWVLGLHGRPSSTQQPDETELLGLPFHRRGNPVSFAKVTWLVFMGLGVDLRNSDVRPPQCCIAPDLRSDLQGVGPTNIVTHDWHEYQGAWCARTVCQLHCEHGVFLYSIRCPQDCPGYICWI